MKKHTINLYDYVNSFKAEYKLIRFNWQSAFLCENFTIQLLDSVKTNRIEFEFDVATRQKICEYIRENYKTLTEQDYIALAKQTQVYY